MTVHTIADEIYRELGSPSDYSVPGVTFWLRGHIGDLNNLISTEFSVSSTDGATVSPDISEAQKSIFKKLFNLYFYGRKILSNLGAAAN
ncbi:MAG: hypothetical protein AABY22_27805, partial [Nanoarchaeota archaeon]